MSRQWTETDIPDLHGRTAVVTGASTGLGFEVTRSLSGNGATVIMACRNTVKAESAAERIRGAVPGARLRTIPLDLVSLASVSAAAAWLRAEYPQLDLLVNNAGGINPRYAVTADGFETTLGTNHLGPFALTGLVLDLLLAAPAGRIVTVSSVGHRRGAINFDDLQSERGYRFQHAYFQSKLANLLFSYELQRRLGAAGSPAIAVAAHPGVRGGEYYGPDGWHEWTGHPVRVESIPRSHDAAAQRRLWETSEQLTGVTYRIAAARGPATNSA